MWKADGFLHVHAAGMPAALVAPVYASDGIGYPALSSVLRAWRDARNERWHLFQRYMAFALDFSEGSLRASEAELPNLELPAEGKRLDTRFGQARCEREWLYVCQVD